MARRLRAQAAVDFMMSYGIALVIVFIAVSIIFKVSLTTPVFVGSLCTSAPGFECETYTISASSGILYLTLSQATGGTIVINGEACASQPNGIRQLSRLRKHQRELARGLLPPSNGPGAREPPSTATTATRCRCTATRTREWRRDSSAQASPDSSGSTTPFQATGL